jgi:LacI family transcriptional regulator
VSKTPGKRRVTLKDVADHARVSLATASLVIQGKGNLREETRREVERAVEAIGYHRRPVAKFQKIGKNYALIVDDISNPYFHSLFEGLDRALESTGHFASLLSSHDSVERQSQILRDLWKSDIDGVILVPATGTSAADLKWLEHRRRPLVMAVRNIANSPFDYVGANPMVGMQLATERLISLGHRSIAFVGGYPANFAYGARYAGFASLMMNKGLAVNPGWIVSGGSTREFGFRGTQRLLEQPDRPRALIGYNDLVAIGAMDAIAAAGLKPGRDIAVVGYDDIPEAALQPVPLTSVATPADRLGQVIAEAIQSRGVDQAAPSPLDITYPPRLVIRKSCGSAIDIQPRADGANDHDHEAGI